MTIRPIKETDNAVMAKIIRENLEYYQLDIPGTAYFDPELDHLYEFYQQLPHAEYWVLIENKQLIGGVGVAPFAENIAELQKLYLSSTAKGKGYGQQLMSHALKFAQTYYQGIYLETFATMDKALRLYEKNQFARLEKPLGASGHDTMDCWYLKKF